MKNFYKLILMLFIANLGYSQTYIPMPTGYGLEGNIGGCKPFYEHNGFLYCYTSILSQLSNGSDYGVIAKVNTTTNQVTIISGTIYLGNKPANLKFDNNNIYFEADYGQLYRININANTLTNLNISTYNGLPYIVINDNIYFSDLLSARVYNVNTNLTTDLLYFDVISNTMKTLYINNLYLNNNDVYCSGSFFNDPNSESMLFKINGTNNNIIRLISTIRAPTSDDGYTYFGNLIRRTSAKKFNNTLLFTYKSSGVYKYHAVNLNNNTVNNNFFTQTNNAFSYILSNQIYINQGTNVFISDGTNTPLASNIPAFEYQVALGGNSFNSFSNEVLETSNSVIGIRNYIPSSSFELWTSDGTFANTYKIKDFSTTTYVNNFDAIEINDIIYFISKENLNDSSKIYRTNRTLLGTYPIFDFGQVNCTNTASGLYYSNNNIFFSTYSNTALDRSLYKLNLSTLSTTNFNQNTKLNISPNPTNGTLTIETKEKINTINIIDILGRKTNITNFENNKIDVGSLQNDIYFLEIATENGLQTQKFIKN